MTYRECNWVRWTHIPTNLSAICRNKRSLHGCDTGGLSLLKAKLAKLREDPSWVEGRSPLIRSYHLNPPLGIPPHVRNHPNGDAIPTDRAMFGAAVLDGTLLDLVMVERRATL